MHTDAAMDDAALRLRIKVIRVSTRAAVHSLGRSDPQVAGIVARGQSLLSELAPAVLARGSDDLRDDLELARAEIDGLDGVAEDR
ncbi:MAG TPA: hypothetical protein VF364_03730 [Candidatus Limnocylindria bacterium]